MHRSKYLRIFFALFLVVTSLGFWSVTPLSHVKHAHADMPIQHIVFIMKENRTFDSYFGLFTGGDGTTTGKVKTASEIQTIPLNPLPDVAANFCHDWSCAHKDYDYGQMDAF